jgi:hypothetical protein
VEECQLPSPTAALFQEGRGRKAAIALHSRCSETLAHTTPIEVVLARAHTPATERGWSELLCQSASASLAWPLMRREGKGAVMAD